MVRWLPIPLTGVAVLCALLAGPPQVLARTRQTVPHAHAAPPPEARIDINHASLEELLKVPGMAGSWAGRIVRYRPYRSKLDLLDRGIVPSDVYDRIKNYVIAHRDKQ